MANLKEIRNRITSVASTMQITSAMKMVSAAKLKKAQDGITQMRPFMTKTIHNAVHHYYEHIEHAINVCGEEITLSSGDSISYKWKVYKGLQAINTIVSYSLDPRFFKLDAYRFEANSDYTVRVTVSTGSFSLLLK